MNRGPEIWKDVAGFEGRYQVSSRGKVRHLPDKHILQLNGVYENTVVFRTEGRGSKSFRITQLVGRAFVGPCPAGFVYYHKNGLRRDHAAENIGIIEKKELYRRRNRKEMKPVARIDRNGEIVAVYKSIADAAAELPFSKTLLANLCNGYYRKDGSLYRYNSAFAADGYAYCWDDEEAIRKRLFRMAKELKDEPVVVSLDGYDAIPAAEQEPDPAGARWQNIEEA